MTSNYDPKPGRWMLPLVVLAMVAFTYVFVRELPTAATTSTTVPGDNGTTTTTEGNGATTTTGGSTTSTSIAADAQEYVDALSAFEVRLTDLQSQLGAANTGFDADPRTVSYDQARAAFEEVLAETTTLAEEVAAVVPPAGFEEAHQAVVAAAEQAVAAADAALEGLLAPAPDTGDDRRAGVAAYDDAEDAFTTAVEGVRALASQA